MDNEMVYKNGSYWDGEWIVWKNGKKEEYHHYDEGVKMEVVYEFYPSGNKWLSCSKTSKGYVQYIHTDDLSGKMKRKREFNDWEDGTGECHGTPRHGEVMSRSPVGDEWKGFIDEDRGETLFNNNISKVTGYYNLNNRDSLWTVYDKNERIDYQIVFKKIEGVRGISRIKRIDYLYLDHNTLETKEYDKNMKLVEVKIYDYSYYGDHLVKHERKNN